MHKTQMYAYIFISLDCIDSGDRGYRILAMKLWKNIDRLIIELQFSDFFVDFFHKNNVFHSIVTDECGCTLRIYMISLLIKIALKYLLYRKSFIYI